MRVILLTALWATTAFAGERTLVLAAGDCHDFDVLDVTTALSNELGGRLGGDALDSGLALDRLRPQPTSTVEAVRHALDAAQTKFYDGKHDVALEGVRSAEKEIERLPATAETWKLQAQALVLEGLVLRALNDTKGSDEAWRKVLSRDKDYALDRDLYTPSTLKQFEQVRKDSARALRVELSVRSSPAGAEVLIDGRSMGKTPWHAALIAGTYRLVLVSGEQRSFAHEVVLNKAVELQVDLPFEAAVQPRRPLCVSAPPQSAIDSGVRLAAVAGAEQAMVVRNESPSGEAGFISVTVVDVKKGSTLRVGGMKLQQAHTPQGVSSLADFLVTGKSTPPVVTFDGTRPVEAVAQKTAEPPPPALAASSEPVVTASASGGTPATRLFSFGLMGVGGASLVTGLVVFAAGSSDRSELSKLIDANGALPPKGSAGYTRAVSLLSSTQTNLNLTLGLCIGGGVVAIAGAALYLLFPPESELHAQLGVGRGGGWAGVSFDF